MTYIAKLKCTKKSKIEAVRITSHKTLIVQLLYQPPICKDNTAQASRRKAWMKIKSVHGFLCFFRAPNALFEWLDETGSKF